MPRSATRATICPPAPLGPFQGRDLSPLWPPPESSPDRAESDGFPRKNRGRIVVKPRRRAARGEEGRIELVAPDLTAYEAGNTGIPYVWRFASERPGPALMINALTHGNELCGAIALDFLFREQVRPLL